MGGGAVRAIVLDAGALIAFERGSRPVAALVEKADAIHIPAGVLAQAWRNPVRQTRLARLTAAGNVTVHALDEAVAKAAGLLCAFTGTADVVDASVVLLSRLVGGLTISSDPDDLRRLRPDINVVAC